MDYYPLAFMGLIVPLAILGGLVYLVMYLVRRNKDQHAPAIDWRRFGVGVALIIVSAYFIGFATSAFFDKLQRTDALIMMLVLSVVFIVAGLAISHHTVISTSLILGAIIAIVYIVGLNIETVPPAVMAILAGLGLALLIFFAYKKLQEREEAR